MLLVVRGDLQSETGWSRATRALVSAIAADFDAVLGCDLHFHPERSLSTFDGAIIHDCLIPKMLTGSRRCVVLHATLPNEIFRVADALNVGWWFWETDKLPNDSDWIERLLSLDHIFVPSPWQKTIVEALGLEVPISVLPWPHAFDDQPTDHDLRPAPNGRIAMHKLWSSSEVQDVRDLDRHYYNSLDKLEKLQKAFAPKERMLKQQEVSLGDVLSRYDGYAFAIQTDAPRKGLPVLLSEWCRYRATAKKNLALIVRFSPLDIALGKAALLQKFSEIALAAAGAQTGVAGVEHVFVVLSSLATSELEAFYRDAVCFISPTFGEGFGGTIVEAVQQDCAIIAPRHTACGQLLPPDYDGAFPSLPYLGTLIGQLSIQPSNASWHLPVVGSIARSLEWIEALTPTQRRDEVQKLRTFMTIALSPEMARATFAAAVRDYIDLPSPSAVRSASSVPAIAPVGSNV